jgi:hypothetical protein
VTHEPTPQLPPTAHSASRRGNPGDVFWGDPVTHSVENLGETVIHNLIVELKDGGGH